MSSTVVRSSQPPDSSIVFILQTPAVPLKPKKLRKTPLTCCSTSKWKHRLTFWSRVSKFSSFYKCPPSLNQCQLRIALQSRLKNENGKLKDRLWINKEETEKLSHLKMSDSLLEEIWICVEISIKNWNELVIFHIIMGDWRIEISSFVISFKLPMTVDYIDFMYHYREQYCNRKITLSLTY